MRTIAVIISSQPSEALHVDVVQGRFQIVRGLLEGHRLAAIERGFIAVEAVGGRALVVAVERLLQLVDGELHPVARGGADHGHPPDGCVSDEDIGRASGPLRLRGTARRGGRGLLDDLVPYVRVVHLDVRPAVGAHVHVGGLARRDGRVPDRGPLLDDLTLVHGDLPVPSADTGCTPGASALAADLQLSGRDPEVDLDDAVDDADGIRVHRVDRRERSHLAAEEVELGAMPRAFDAVIVDLALAEGAAVVGADVVDRAPRPIEGVADGEGAPLGADDRDLTGRDVGRRRDRPPARPLVLGHAASSSSAMRPMRGASAARTRAPTCGSGISLMTRWKNPRTSICSAFARSSPRDMT